MEFKNEIQQVYNITTIAENHRYIYLRWFGTYLSVEEIARVGNWELDQCEKLGITRIINDNTELHGSWDHATDYNANIWLPRALSLGINKLAHVVSQNIFEKLSAEEMEHLFEGKIEVKMFQDFPSAEAWVLE